MVRPIHLRFLGLPGSGKSTAAALLYACLVDRASATPPVVRYYMDVDNLRAASSLFRRAVSTPPGTSVEGPDGFSLSFEDTAHSSGKGSREDEGIPLRVDTQSLSASEGDAASLSWPSHEAVSAKGPTLVANLWVLDSGQLLKPGEELRIIASALRSLPSPPKESRWHGRTDTGPVNFLLLTKWDLWEGLDLPIGYGQLVPPPSPSDARARQNLFSNLLTRAGANDAPTGPLLPVPLQFAMVFSGRSSTSNETRQGTAFERFLTPYTVSEYTALLTWLAGAARD
jgi:hypothetical protein